MDKYILRNELLIKRAIGYINQEVVTLYWIMFF